MLLVLRRVAVVVINGYLNVTYYQINNSCAIYVIQQVWFDGLQTCVDVITAFEKDQGGV